MTQFPDPDVDEALQTETMQPVADVSLSTSDDSVGLSPSRQGLSISQFFRGLWGQLTSMKTALILLFLLAVAAIPGSLVPQRRVSALQVRDFMTQHRELGKIFNAIGLFDVYASVWFSAIYLLLFISLIGCIIPRSINYVRALRRPPAPLPKNLHRLTHYRRIEIADLSADQALTDAAAWLRKRRFRVVVEQHTIAAEKGYLREAGNLIFHISLVGCLIAIAWTNLVSFTGTAVVPEGRGFSNVITQYDEFSSGAWFNPSQLNPITINIDKFTVSFEKTPKRLGMPTDFQADVRVRTGTLERSEQLKVNHPAVIDNTFVHLLGHGYCAQVTVRDGQGNISFAGPVMFLPQDSNFSSTGVIKAPDSRPQRLAFEGMFLPTATVDSHGPHSVFPDAINPELFLTAYSGEPRAETGTPESVFRLDKTGLAQIKKDDHPFAMRLKPSATVELPDGRGSITFDGYQRWVKLQISHQPGAAAIFVWLALAVVGLCCSLYIRPRRVWLRVQDGGVEVAGLDRIEGRPVLATDVAALVARLEKNSDSALKN